MEEFVVPMTGTYEISTRGVTFIGRDDMDKYSIRYGKSLIRCMIVSKNGTLLEKFRAKLWKYYCKLIWKLTRR